MLCDLFFFVIHLYSGRVTGAIAPHHTLKAISFSLISASYLRKAFQDVFPSCCLVGIEDKEEDNFCM